MDGLAYNQLSGVVQDSRGFLWIATFDGLSRYDGTSFQSYYHQVGTDNTLPSNQIATMSLLPGDRLLMATFGGVCILNTRSMHFRVFQDGTHADYYAYNNNFLGTCADSSHHIWAYSRTTLYLFDDSLRLLKSWYNPEIARHPYEYVNKVFLTSSGGVAIIIGDTVRRYLYPVGRFVVDSALTRAIRPHGDVTFIMQSHHGLWWVKVHSDSLYHYSEREGARGYQIPAFLEKKREHLYASLFITRDSLLWCGEVKGTLVRFNMRRRVFDTDYIHIDAESHIGSWVFTLGVIRDSQQDLWVATLDGLYRYREPRSRPFQHVYYIRQGLIPDADINSLVRQGGGFWLGSYGNGLCYVNPAREEIRHVGMPTWLTNWVWNLSRRSRDTLWIGTQEGLLWMDVKSRHLGRVGQSSIPGGTDSHTIGTQFLDAEHELWMSLGGSQGLICYDLRTGIARRYLPEPGIPFISAITEDENGDLWMGSLNGGGLVKWDRQTDRFSIWRAHARSAFEDDRIAVIYADKHGSIWFNSGSNGLERYQVATGRFTNYGHDQGLCSDIIRGISGEDGHLWIATVNGLGRFDEATGQFKTYSVADGLPANYFSYVACRNDTVYAAGKMMFLYFRDDLTTGNTRPPGTCITGVTVRGKPLPPGTSSARLPYNQNYVRFDFTGINLIKGSENKYAYMLQGVDKDWVRAGGSRYAVYTQLAPGTYIFKVMSANGAGVWNRVPATFSLMITPPFWSTAWFYLLGALVVFCIVYGSYRYRLRQLVKVQGVRDRIAADLHDDMGASLSNITILSTMALRRPKLHTPDVKRMIENIRDDAQQMSEAIDDIVWTVNPRNDSFDRILSRMRYYASELFEAKGIHYEINFPAEVTHLKLPMEKRRDLFLIFKEAVNNVVKHSGCTRVEISLLVRGRRIRLRLSDNGDGLPEAKHREGNGLRNMKLRAKSLHGTLKVTSETGKGTSIILVI